MSQKQMILNHLKENGSITSMEAFKKYGATRLSDIVYRLRHDGYKIVNIQRNCINRYGKKVFFTEYRLKEE